jgi:hypothetical protein
LNEQQNGLFQRFNICRGRNNSFDDAMAGMERILAKQDKELFLFHVAKHRSLNNKCNSNNFKQEKKENLQHTL